jgi:AcrR family transcriptional regulator
MAPSEDSTRIRILKAALELASEEGPSALTTRRVAAAAGVNLGLLHYYFKSKEALVAEVFGLYLEELRADPAHADGREADPAAMVAGMLDSAFSTILRRKGIFFGLLGKAAGALSTTNFASVDELGGSHGLGSIAAMPLKAVRNVKSSIFPYVVSYIESILGDGNPELAQRRAMQVMLSVFNPLLFTDMPRVAFGLDLRDPAVRKQYLLDIVRDSARPPNSR